MNKPGIYKIENLINGKIYIGSASINFIIRWNSHKNELKNNKHPNIHLQNAWNLYGEENFVFEVIEEVPILENESKKDFKLRLVDDREQYYLDTLLFAQEYIKNENSFTGNKEVDSEIIFDMSYRSIPLPWKLLVLNPEIEFLERTARREIFSYGILFFVIFVSMLLGAMLIIRDITRETETTRLKTEFVHNISHELKTPLTLIRLYGETLQFKKNLTDGAKKESYEIITKESERLSHLINNILDFSRIETGRKEFVFKKGNLARIVQDTLESFRYHLEKKSFTIRTDISFDLPEMNFDEEAIISVIVNLLSNVMKFSPQKKEVSIKLFKDNGKAVIQVADKGIGIPPNEISKIFRRYYRSKNKTVSETKGSGIGLTLVRHIIDAHNGEIKIESEPNKGTIFSIILPIDVSKMG